jgi:hypothetical protein
MRSFPVIIIILLLCGAMYLLGRKNGSTQLKADVVNNTQLIQQIAELAVLEANGQTTVKLSNAGDEAGVWANFKNFFTENTLQVSIPYTAKYGVDMAGSKIKLQQQDTLVTIGLPPVKMLSLQLRLDKMQLMNQTGLFAETTIQDMQRAQQQLYNAAQQGLVADTAMLAKAKAQLQEVFTRYYQPLGYRVQCTFQ